MKKLPLTNQKQPLTICTELTSTNSVILSYQALGKSSLHLFSKLNLMKKFTLITLIILASFTLKAQSYVTIPDSNFVTWLTIHIPSAMMGNQMDTSNVAVTSMTTMNVSHDSIFDLNGIQYFTALQNLDCSWNQLDTLAHLPNNLITLDCSSNYLILIDSLPSSLQSFICNANYLTWLPSLPNSITSFSCVQNQLDTLPNLPVNLPSLMCSNNLLTHLPALPNSILTIDCQTNELDSLPTLPTSLTSLNCINNLLTSLPSLPGTLNSLICNTNHLTALPTLPSSLTNLDCYSNFITSLPALPGSLQTLICSYNPLSSLPTLPASLLTLKCYDDSLLTLPILPGSLNYLDCSGNYLTTLPALPGSLTFLSCASNQIPALPVLPSSLIELNCSNNLLSVLPVLPNLLQTLNCNNNPLSGLPTLPNSLFSLFCENDGLTILPVLSTSLYYLDCSVNVLVSLPTLPSSLSELFCTNNHLTSLPTLPNALNYLECTYNQLTSLPIIPNSLSHLSCQYNMITCFPEFPNSMTYIALNANPFTCLANYIPAMDSITLNYPLCVYGDLINNPNNCASAQGLVGFTFTDNNSNCMLDTADYKLKNIDVKLYDNLGVLLSQTYTASNGVYNFAEPAGTYTAVVDTTSVPFISQCASPGIDSTVTTTIATPLISDINFDFNCKPGFDIGVQSINHIGLAFPGETHTLRIDAGDITQWYNMHCASGISGTVEVKVTGPVSYLGAAAGAITPVVTGHIYTYTIADFGLVNNKKAFGLQFKTDTTAAAGSQICVEVAVTPLGGDNDSSNNTTHLCYSVTNSHDPNFKETFPQIVSPAYDAYFTYSIHFQNSGNAAAINIRLADTLDSNLDPSTFQLINYSHENVTTLTGNFLNVSFPNIMLPDSTASADSSKGFIQYRIKALPSRPIGTTIYNTGYIYFDYNEAVVTNTTTNVYRGVVAGIDEKKTTSEINVFPNPSNGIFNVKFSKEMNATIEVYNLLGETVLVSKTQNAISQIDLSQQPKGVYIIKVTTDQESFNQRLIKQ